MGIIKVLDKNISELIAAGEVIERPASVVKELVENSIDAGATKIKIEIKNGGVTYIKITDNGVGIKKEDIKTAFLRHATSKVGKVEDLDNILTLGFRGEALASICAVSKMELITRTKEDEYGTKYTIEGQNEGKIEDIGAPIGTTIIVKDLFYNVPARMKFLKKDVTEGNAIASIIDRLALSHPEISFTFMREGNEKLATFGDNNLLSAIYCVFGKQFASTVIPLEYEENHIVINGYISNPAESRASRSMQTFFVNSRYVKSKTCCVALEEAYKSFLVQGKFPACVLNIEIPNNIIDINVHPAKLEIRFANEKMIYDLIYVGVKNCILSYAHNPIMNLNNKNLNNIKNIVSNFEESALNKGNNFKNSTYFMSSNSPNLKYDNKLNNKKEFFKRNSNSAFVNVNDFKQVVSEINKSYDEINNLKEKINSDKIEDEKIEFEKVENEKNEKIEDENIKDDGLKKPEKLKISLFGVKDDNKFVGEIFNSYIIMEREDNIIFIDKHAAHERIIYEKIKDGRFKNYRQILLAPKIMDVSLLEYQTVIDNIEAFKNMGFEVEDFGDKTIIIREVPMILSDRDIEEIVGEIINNMVNNKNNIQPHILDKIYSTFACKAAIKAGDNNDKLELEELTKILKENQDLKNCPHGRPITFIIKKKDIDKQFLR